MKDINKYYDATKKDKPHKNLRFFIDNIRTEPTNAVDLGCGQGNDVLFLIKNGWNVLGIDRENVEDRIRTRLNNKEQLLFKFELQDFEELKSFKANLIVANFSLSFCNNKKFKNTWKTIEESLQSGGYFVGNLLGVKDSWMKNKLDMTFFTKEDIEKLFKCFQIINFNEVETDKTTALGNQKHWHFFDVIAKKL